jgi:glycosyltransferase involved in cell wall biosynthesis
LPYSQPYVDELLGIISKSNLSERVIFLTTTPFPIDELHELYELSEFVVLPYVYSFAASLPFSFAIQHAKPVVATNIGVFKGEIGHNVDGLLCSPRSTYSLEKAIEKLIENPCLRKELSLKTQLKADNRRWSRVAEQTYRAYTQTLKR